MAESSLILHKHPTPKHMGNITRACVVNVRKREEGVSDVMSDRCWVHVLLHGSVSAMFRPTTVLTVLQTSRTLPTHALQQPSPHHIVTSCITLVRKSQRSSLDRGQEQEFLQLCDNQNYARLEIHNILATTHRAAACRSTSHLITGGKSAGKDV